MPGRAASRVGLVLRKREQAAADTGSGAQEGDQGNPTARNDNDDACIARKVPFAESHMVRYLSAQVEELRC